MLLRIFFKNDVFISYARADASLYAVALANELTKRDLSCWLDQLGTEPGKDLPKRLLRIISRSTVFVLVATQHAWDSEFVKKELEEFGRTGRPIIPIVFDEPKAEPSQLLGLPKQVEDVRCLESGPSGAVIQRIVYTVVPAGLIGRARRLFRRTVITSVLLLLGSLVVSAYIVRTAKSKANTLQVTRCP